MQDSTQSPQVLQSLVLLDRDGTIIENKHYLSDPEGVELLPKAVEGLRCLGQKALLALVSNQSGIGRGYFGEEALQAVNDRLVSMLCQDDVQLFGLYHCPHAPNAECACRKPGTAMALEALKDAESKGYRARITMVVGDSMCDVDLGLALGAVTVLVRTGHGMEVERELGARAGKVHVVDDLLEAAALHQTLIECRPG